MYITDVDEIFFLNKKFSNVDKKNNTMSKFERECFSSDFVSHHRSLLIIETVKMK